MKCFANWIALEGSDEILFQIPNLTITELAFNALDSPELMERGVSCLCNFIKRISSLEACQPLFEFALEKVLALFPQLLLKKLFKNFENIFFRFKVFVKEELIDEEREFIDIFVTFGKRFLNQLMNYENEKSFMFFQQMFEMTFLENSSS